ncbi:acyl-CoA dehydrogenase [Paraburkholderia sp. BL10I2N1]|uniref:acyl-CoA dehydrogenase family protein n=1 Tax=Paraburkholderia sp. BL10I2N1 TaxID=1938796 RepID=UPI00105C1F45|nr:acyl-CoA dehydrogenase [Paraburkholderia sp. BL10I2N1]TDN59243.1 alkylation response protein AidB-like acyl-CoA dehydrogenase [Paraburkholderia sp. BL10I2N1]
MDFTLVEEQQMLADVVGRFVDNEYGFEARRRLAATPQGWSAEHWSTLAKMGLLALNVPEQYGGLAASPAETMIVMEAFGRGLVLEPYLSSAVLGTRLIGRAAHETHKASWLNSLAGGTLKTALATLEPGARFDLWNVTTMARASGTGYVLNGRKGVVLHGDSADVLLVSARTSGGATDTAGITLFAVDAKAPGVTVKGFPALDGQRVAEITLAEVEVGADAVLGAVGEGYPLLEWTVDHGIFALCAEAVGTMAKLADLTYDYLRTRKQFGSPIGKFQALQHRAADILTAVEQARSMVYFAAAKLDGDDASESHRAVCAAKAMIGRSGRFIAQQAVQLHGGMGMTDELSVGWYVKRLTCIDMTWGNIEHHVELYGAYL